MNETFIAIVRKTVKQKIKLCAEHIDIFERKKFVDEGKKG